MRAKFLATLCCSLLLGMSAAANAEMVNGVYQWQFLSGQPWPAGYNRNTGKPDNLIYARNEYPPEFFERINNALPERRINEAFLTDDSGSTITLVEDGEVYVTFIHEGAGYRNSFGFFTFDANNPPQRKEDINVTIAFPNLSFPHLTNGHRLKLGDFEAGTSIGFFIAANGYWWYSGVKDFRIPYYYSLSGFNPEPTEELRQHAVMLFDEEVDEVILGFEDLNRTWGDNDFNDAVFSVKVTPGSALLSENLTAIPSVNDSDADGVVDDQDEFPNDFRRAYSSYYPSSNDYVTLAFEDNWPKVGDYDMNDLVIQERLQTIYSAEGGVSGFKLNGYIVARGASNRNGFAVRLIDTDSDLVERGTLTIAGEEYPKSAEDFQTNAVVSLWSDTHRFTNTGESGKCSHFNTQNQCARFDPVPFELDVRFSQDIAQLSHSDLDFFIYRTNNRGHEIHFADYEPTDLFNPYLMNTHADTSDPSTGRYFRNAQNLPWALKLSGTWNHPREYIDVLWAYPNYEQWVESSGSSYVDWYKTTTRNRHIMILGE